jgi:Protein of unknown function (DUF3421)
MIVNKKVFVCLVSTLGIAIGSLGSLVMIAQPALADYRWVAGKNGSVPAGAVEAGYDNNDKLYVCRITQSNVSGGVVNGKLHPRTGRCYVAYQKEYEFTTYEVLVGNNLRWVPFEGVAGQNIIVAGSERNGVPLFVCRARLGSGVTPGKYHPVNKICYVPYGGKYSDNRSGEILVEPVRYSPSISGEVTLTPANSAQCQDLKVHLVSTEQSPPPPNSVLNLGGDPIFSYSQPMSGDIKTGKCNYSIKAFSIDSWYKARLGVSGGGETWASNSPTITIPKTDPIKINFDAGINRIN